MDIIALIIYVILMVLFTIHLIAELKKTADFGTTEIYESDLPTNKELQQIITNKKPILFSLLYEAPILFETTIKNIYDEYKDNEIVELQYDGTSILKMPLGKALNYCNQYTNYGSTTKENLICYYYPPSTNTGIWKSITEDLNEWLYPAPIVVKQNLGIIFGSQGSFLYPEYHTETAKFLIVMSGSVQVKMVSWKNGIKLGGGVYSDYLKRDFRMGNDGFINIWNSNVPKIMNYSFMDFLINKGMVLYIPSYCFWSIKILEPDTFITTMDYSSLMNNIVQYPFYMFSVVKELIGGFSNNDKYGDEYDRTSEHGDDIESRDRVIDHRRHHSDIEQCEHVSVLLNENAFVMATADEARNDMDNYINNLKVIVEETPEDIASNDGIIDEKTFIEKIDIDE